MKITEPILKGFKVYRQTSESANLIDYNRTDLYKICLFTGKGSIRFNGKEIQVDGHILFFGTPGLFHDFNSETIAYQAYSCIFTRNFMKETSLMTELEEEFLFSENNAPVFYLNELQRIQLVTVFKDMMYEQDHKYRYRHELIQSYLKLIILEAMKQQPFQGIFYQYINKNNIV
ncbi:MAG: hypothetical protein LBE92_04355 [Chryseobacterium sp.]|uniref:hypothetical protein n=1 Tax=Chryseobacterium sp. TaxID=1871047 RepID=UPI00282C8A5A|nr:hypothetical protein [Chryseobacterium sp.]MDR2235336.1 hypothetical protein [Chryseobacterium sp.]